MRRLTLLIAIAFIAAACGGGTSSATFESLDTSESSTLTPSAGSEMTTTSVVTDGATTTVAPTDTETTVAAPTELPDSDYPDVVVADLAGGEVNLRELALGAEPVLLWFWAPH